MAERLATVQPTWTGASVNPYATARATVNTSTGAFMTMVQAVRAELHPVGTQLVEEAASYWKVIQYPEHVYACTPANVRRISFREEVWLAAQQNLSQLIAATSAAPFVGPLPPVASAERKYVAALFADWYVLVMSWVSLAAYSTNIQPGFLCPDNATTLLPDGLLKPTRTAGDGLPNGLATIRGEILGTPSVGNAYVREYIDKDEWGPMWMGYYDRGQATGWLVGDFNPQTDPKAHNLKYGNGGVDYIYPGQNYKSGSCPDSKTTMRSRITDPWYQCFYTVLHWDFGSILVPWRQHDTTGINETFTRYLLGPNALKRIAVTWAAWVGNSTMMDVIMQSSTWYATNYMQYWQKKGLSEFPPSVAARLAKTQAGEAMRVRQAAANRTIDTINNTAVSLTVALAAVPWAGAVAAGCAMLVKGITMLIMRRRRKKQKPVPVMQPLMLRSLSNPDCDYFAPGTLLQESLAKFLGEVKSAQTALSAAPVGIVPPLAPDDPMSVGSPIAASAGVPGAEQSVSPDAGRLTQIAPLPSGNAINTSTSAGIRPGAVLTTTRDIAAAEVQVQRTPPVSSGTPTPPGQVPWVLIGLSGLAAVAVIKITRRR